MLQPPHRQLIASLRRSSYKLRCGILAKALFHTHRPGLATISNFRILLSIYRRSGRFCACRSAVPPRFIGWTTAKRRLHSVPHGAPTRPARHRIDGFKLAHDISLMCWHSAARSMLDPQPHNYGSTAFCPSPRSWPTGLRGTCISSLWKVFMSQRCAGSSKYFQQM